MEITPFAIFGSLLGLVIGAVVTLLVARGTLRSKIASVSRKADEQIAEAREKATAPLMAAQSLARSADGRVRELEKELKAVRSEVQKREERLAKREEVVDRKAESLSAREADVARREKAAALKEKEFATAEAERERLVAEARKTLERVAGMNQEEAKKFLMDKIMDEVKLAAARNIRQIEDEAKEEAEKRSKRIISLAIMRYAGEYANERTVSVVHLPSEEMKGRIIGREGRNIRAFEAATGIDVIIDDSPDAVILSGFNPVRREVARLSLEKLITDGRIHPARIEELVEKTTREVDQKIKEAGEDALFQLALGTMHPNLVKLVGRLKYRTSYAQNVLTHSIEVAFLAGLMAAEIGLPVKEARRAGLLHDIGKAVDHEVEGPHALVGANFARKHGESAEIVHAIAAHHDEEKPLTMLAHLVMASDAISGARPGARRENLENYMKRLSDLEEISNSFSGVERSFAIQAGREVRVMVENGRVSDEEVGGLARDIANKIEEKLAYPGQIKICVIRETRAVEFAK